MKHKILWLIFVCVAVVAGCLLFFAIRHSETSTADAWTPFRVADDPTFGSVENALTNLVKANGPTGENTPCVLGEKFSDGKIAWVYWPQGKAAILWDDSVFVQNPNLADLTRSRRYLRIPEDFVPNENDPRYFGSTFLETQAWLNDLIASCNQYGETFTIYK